MMMMRMIVAAALVVVAVLSVGDDVSALPSNMTGPVIGILTQPLSPETPAPDHTTAPQSPSDQKYIAASYVKFLESSGARVVPIHCNISDADLAVLLSKLNGALFPGGGQDLTDQSNCYTHTATRIMDAALKMNEKEGDYFPVWATCLGFQMMSVFVGGNEVLEGGFDSENLPLPLNFTADVATSRIFAQAPRYLLSAFATEPITMNNHGSGVTVSTYATNAKLSSFFNVISTNNDRKGRAFVSTIEGKTVPFYATQWHPEKNSFEWTPSEDIPHTPNAIAACQLTSNFFVNEARKSAHSFGETGLMKQLIYNYNPVFSGKEGSGFDQIYLF